MVATHRAHNWSTVLCVLCSVGAGLGAAFFGCILSWADHVKRRNGGRHTRRSHVVAILGCIGSTLFGFSSLVGLYFGPVTLVVVIRAGSLLPANALFSQIFGLRPLTRDDYLGTVVTISGVLCFSIFGGSPAAAPSETAFLEMMTWSGAILCNVILFFIFMGSLSALLLVNEDNPLLTNLAVTHVGGVSSAFMDLAAKGWSAPLAQGLDHAWYSNLFWASLALNAAFLVTMRVSMIYGCKRCDVLMFVPLNTVLNIFYSVIAGMVVLQEYQQVISWPGLISASTSVLGGVVMLVSGPASDPNRQDERPSQGKGSCWSSEQELDGSDMEVFVNRRTPMIFVQRPPLLQTPEDSPAASVAASPGRSPLRSPSKKTPRTITPQIARASFGQPLHTEPGDDDYEMVPATAVSSRGILSSIAHGLRPEIVKLNSVHREAARAKRQWQRIRRRLRKLVGEEDSVYEASEGSPVRRAASRSSGSVGSDGPDSFEDSDGGSGPSSDTEERSGQQV